ncbi:MAG: hypothetical protein ACQERJ_07695 [Bacillota bacterium]
MDLTNTSVQQEYVAVDWFLDSKVLKEKLLKKLFELSDAIDNSSILSKSQFNKLTTKFKEVENDGNKINNVEKIMKYIDGQMKKDEVGRNWTKVVETKDGKKKYGTLLKEIFVEYKTDIENNLGAYLPSGEDSKAEMIEKYWAENEEKFEFELYRLILSLFKLVELYGKEYYQDFLEEEADLQWRKV